MSYCNIFYCKLINVISFFIKNKKIKSDINISNTKNINDKNIKVFYLLNSSSILDFLIFRKKCLEYNFPDPLNKIKINNINIVTYFMLNKIYKNFNLKNIELIKLIKIFNKLQDENFKIRIFLVSICFGRLHNKYFPKYYIKNFLISIKKIFYIIFFKKDIFLHISKVILLNKNLINKKIIFKFLRFSNIYFIRQDLIISGPKKISKKKLLNSFLKNESIKKAIKDEFKIKKISYKKAKKKFIKILLEIAANFSYVILRLTDRVMSYICSKMYQGINVNGIEKVKEIAKKGHKIIYLPCHKSHMDYLLLSYVMYHNGFIPPHIVAGINLNFWPAGFIFRRLGAFFIRRTFKSNKLYTTVFKEYLKNLFDRGFSIECFIEGSRSRTGKLINPKTGTLSIVIQSMINNKNSNSIVLLPIYIGYENVTEVSTYIKELKGAKKKREGIIQTLISIFNLRNLGQVYLNFGEPLFIFQYLKFNFPKYYNQIINENKKLSRTILINPLVNNIAQQIMIRINNACAINSVNLCAVVLLSSKNYSLHKNELLEYIEFYIQLLSNVPYSKEFTIIKMKANTVLQNAVKIHKFLSFNKNNIIKLSAKQALLMQYYSNNISHVLILPSLLANILYIFNSLKKEDLLNKVLLIYPIIKKEFFLGWNKKEVVIILEKIILEFTKQKIIVSNNKNIFFNIKKIKIIILMSSILQKFLKKYAVIFLILKKNSVINRISLEEKTLKIYKDIFATEIYKKNYLIEKFNKNTFFLLLNVFKKEGYTKEGDKLLVKKIEKIYDLLNKLIINKKIKLKINSYLN